MALDYTGVTADTLSGTNYQAKDGEQAVSVQVSSEVLDDQGEYDAKVKASEKYAAEDYTTAGDIRIVTVRTTDF